jgi:hypothetical protein
MSSFIYDVLRGDTPPANKPNIPRNRDRNSLVATTLTEQTRYTSCSDLTWRNTYSSQVVANGQYEWMADEVVVDFHGRRKRGEIFFNPMSSESFTYASTDSAYHIQSNGISCANTGTKAEYKAAAGPWLAHVLPKMPLAGKQLPILAYSATSADLDRLCKEVSTEVLSKRGRGDANLYETAAEANQTVDLFTKPMTRATTWMNSMGRAVWNRQGDRESAKAAASAWITYRYAIRPIMMDLANIYEVLNKIVFETRKTTRARGQIMTSSIVRGSGNFGNIITNYANSVTDVITVKGTSLDEMSTSFIDSLGLSPKSLILVPWDLVTASFVADWFLNFGDYLGTIAPAIGWKQLGSTLSITHVTSNAYKVDTCVLNNPSTHTLLSPIGGEVGIVKVAKRRQALSTPGIVVKSDFRFDKITRVADAASLLAQRLIRVTKSFR